MLTTRDPGPVVVLLSGGLDSTVCAHMALAQGRLAAVISFNYGQPGGAMELLGGHMWAERHKVRREVVDLPLFGVSLTMRTGAGAEGPRVLPGRNLVMLAVAVNFAASIGAREVYFGANADDAADYPDCTPTFSYHVGHAASLFNVNVVTPLLWRSKAEVVALARELGVDIAATWSCYEPRGSSPCGTCNACVLRAKALA